MQQVETIAEMRSVVANARAHGKSISFVPTMGALHEGHLKLVDGARRVGDFVVMSIFVNPLQFGPNEDFARYPRTLEHDSKLAEGRGVDFLFTPTREDMYPSYAPVVQVHSGSVGKEWEGAQRPHHFEGVLTVVAKLFHIVMPDVAVFGQKDLQQVAAVKAPRFGGSRTTSGAKERLAGIPSRRKNNSQLTWGEGGLAPPAIDQNEKSPIAWVGFQLGE